MVHATPPTTHVSAAVEDYAKAIYALESRSGEPVGTNALADRLGVTPGSAFGDAGQARGARPGHA